MKKKEVARALAALKTLKMPQISDKELRNNIITTHFALLREQRRFEDAVADLETVHLAAFLEERRAVDALQRRLNTEQDRQRQIELAREINGHVELAKAYDAFNDAVRDLGNEDVDIKPIDHDRFVAAIDGQDYDLGLIESLFPLFA